MDFLIREIRKERMGEPLDVQLKQNKEFMENRKQYHNMSEVLQEKLGKDEEDRDFLIHFDEMVGEYSSSYGETAYTLGFHDGLNLGLEHGKYRKGKKAEEISALSVEDMTQLIYILDAYKSLNKSLLGEETTLGFHEGILGTLGRIYKIIGNHIPEEMRMGEYLEQDEILSDLSLEPEERAKRLFGK